MPFGAASKNANSSSADTRRIQERPRRGAASPSKVENMVIRWNLHEERGKFLAEKAYSIFVLGKKWSCDESCGAESRGEMEVHVVPRGHGRAIERGGLVMPTAESCFDLLVNAVADRLHDLGLNHVALSVNGDLDDDVASQLAGKLGAIDGRVGINNRVGDVNLVSGNRAFKNRAQRGTGLRVRRCSWGGFDFCV
jgi:hypothetical protein